MTKSGSWQINLQGSRVLLLNDDGINAPGLKILKDLLMPHVAELWVVAPEKEESGTSHAISLHRPLRLREIEERRFAVDGSPADAAILALGHIMRDSPPELVISGINRGANLGDDVGYSGTVGAAMEAALSGLPAVSLSLCRTPPARTRWDTVEKYLVSTLNWVLSEAWPLGAVLNVNFPDVDPTDVKGKRYTRLGRRKPGGEIVERTDPAGRTYYWIGSKRILGEVFNDTDIAATDQGYISVTPLTFDLTDKEALSKVQPGMLL